VPQGLHHHRRHASRATLPQHLPVPNDQSATGESSGGTPPTARLVISQQAPLIHSCGFLGQAGQPLTVLELLDRAVGEGLRPNEGMAAAALAACADRRDADAVLGLLARLPSWGTFS
jgi:hypothetical protein